MQFKPKEYEAKLKEDLVCFQCNKEMKNIPTLKAHLQDEWNKRERASRTTAKRKREIQDSEKPPTEVHARKIPSDAETESNVKKAKSQKIEETASSTPS
jgi:aprataxin